jgi:murein DD-endopeptidase MepM/ murein hydrolase activator NlpD
MNAEGEKEIFEYIESQGYISTSTGEKYVPANRNSGDLKFLIFPDANDKSSNVFQAKNEDETDAKPPVAVKKQEVEKDERPGPISDLPAAIAPSNGSTNFRGGTFGCVRMMSVPNPNSENYEQIKRFCVRCNNCAPLPNNPSSAARYHDGLDISMPFGTPIKAIYGGVIRYVQNDGDHAGLGSYCMISTKTASGSFTIVYGHLSGSSFDMSLSNKKVVKGTRIASTGNTGNIATLINIPVIQQHCHLQVKVNGEKVNPKPYIWEAMKTVISKYD